MREFILSTIADLERMKEEIINEGRLKENKIVDKEKELLNNTVDNFIKTVDLAISKINPYIESTNLHTTNLHLSLEKLKDRASKMFSETLDKINHYDEKEIDLVEEIALEGDINNIADQLDDSEVTNDYTEASEFVNSCGCEDQMEAELEEVNKEEIELSNDENEFEDTESFGGNEHEDTETCECYEHHVEGEECECECHHKEDECDCYEHHNQDESCDCECHNDDPCECYEHHVEGEKCECECHYEDEIDSEVEMIKRDVRELFENDDDNVQKIIDTTKDCANMMIDSVESYLFNYELNKHPDKAKEVAILIAELCLERLKKQLEKIDVHS